jgi:hypothetical protein
MKEETYDAATEAIKNPLGPIIDRLRPSTIFKETIDYAFGKLLPHGADEIGNALYPHSPNPPWGNRDSEGGKKNNHTEIYNTQFNDSEVNVYGTPPEGWEAELDRASDRGKPPEADQGLDR